MPSGHIEFVYPMCEFCARIAPAEPLRKALNMGISGPRRGTEINAADLGLRTAFLTGLRTVCSSEGMADCCEIEYLISG